MKRYFFYFAILLMAGTSMRCKPEEQPKPGSTTATMVMEVQPMVNGQPLTLNKMVQGSNGLKFDIKLFMAYLSNIRLVKEDNTEEKVQDVVLIDLDPAATKTADPNTVGTKFTITVPAGNYKGINMGLGVPKDINVVKQNYPNTHALSVYRGTSWDWAGYRFIMMEGNAGDSSVDFQYHVATDSFYREMSFSNAISFNGGDTKTVKVMIDMDKIFNPADPNNKLDPVAEPFSHSGSKAELDISRRITDNLKNAISLQ